MGFTAAAPLVRVSALAVLLLAVAVKVTAFEGRYFSGTGGFDRDERFIELLDIARRQFSPEEYQYQTTHSLYRGSWDGMMEGPTWGAWWTQNSYGPILASLPYLDDANWHGVEHSMAWWFNSIGNGTKIDGTFHTTNTANGPVPAPDGCLCDAAVPCGNAADNCCAYKQGDGNVPMHDWTFEETLSAVVMKAEQLLISRNTTAIVQYLPLFERTSNMLESRRDERTSYSTFLTGPSSNLLAPSFGGSSTGNGTFGGWAALTGVSVTYIGALTRMIECAKLVAAQGGTNYLPAWAERRTLTINGLALLRDPTHNYFARSRDPDGTLHGVLGQSKHGYFEASPNHDAIALRVVDAAEAEKIMVTTDTLGAKIRPHTFMIPNTDAGGGVGYDDMLCGTGKQCGGIFAYGVWVNGGFWATQEARAILAYFRTDRPDAAARSMEAVLANFIEGWRMDAPLSSFGSTVWADDDINLTIDAFGHGAALIRGIFEYIFTAEDLTLVPKYPQNITALVQKFGVRWGAYRLFISTKGQSRSNSNSNIAPLVCHNGAQSGFEMCFDIGSRHLGCCGQNTSRIQNKEVHPTLYLQAFAGRGSSP